MAVDVFPVEAVAADAPVDIGEDNLELMKVVSIVEASFTFGSVVVSFAIVDKQTVVAVTVEVFGLELDYSTGAIFFLCDSDDVCVGRVDAVGPVVLVASDGFVGDNKEGPSVAHVVYKSVVGVVVVNSGREYAAFFSECLWGHECRFTFWGSFPVDFVEWGGAGRVGNAISGEIVSPVPEATFGVGANALNLSNFDAIVAQVVSVGVACCVGRVFVTLSRLTKSRQSLLEQTPCMFVVAS